jgi:hypothetical protein
MTKKKTDTEKYQDTLMSQAKGTIGLGIVTGLGSYAFGRLGSAHPTVAPTANAVTGALNLANVGNMASIGLGMAKGIQTFGNNKTEAKPTKKKGNAFAENRISRILG